MADSQSAPARASGRRSSDSSSRPACCTCRRDLARNRRARATLRNATPGVRGLQSKVAIDVVLLAGRREESELAGHSGESVDDIPAQRQVDGADWCANNEQSNRSSPACAFCRFERVLDGIVVCGIGALERDSTAFEKIGSVRQTIPLRALRCCVSAAVR